MDNLIPWVGILFYGLPILIIGYFSKIRPPKTINHLFGYRTHRSMKTQHTWDYANKISSNLLIYAGVLTCIFGLIPLFTTWHNAHFIPLFVLLASLFIGIAYCEKQLAKHFDKDGNPLHK